MGKMLMAKCRTLQEENEEIGTQAEEGKVSQFYMCIVFSGACQFMCKHASFPLKIGGVWMGCENFPVAFRKASLCFENQRILKYIGNFFQCWSWWIFFEKKRVKFTFILTKCWIWFNYFDTIDFLCWFNLFLCNSFFYADAWIGHETCITEISKCGTQKSIWRSVLNMLWTLGWVNQFMDVSNLCNFDENSNSLPFFGWNYPWLNIFGSCIFDHYCFVACSTVQTNGGADKWCRKIKWNGFYLSLIF